jgi:hypothetical protein
VSTARRSHSPRPRWAGLAFIGFFLLAALVVTQTCQEQDVRIDEERAVATARKEIDFDPDKTAVRFVRQGVPSRPYYAVSFSIGREGEADHRLTTVLVDARSGQVAEINREA